MKPLSLKLMNSPLHNFIPVRQICINQAHPQDLLPKPPDKWTPKEHMVLAFNLPSTKYTQEAPIVLVPPFVQTISSKKSVIDSQPTDDRMLGNSIWDWQLNHSPPTNLRSFGSMLIPYWTASLLTSIKRFPLNLPPVS